MPNIATALKDEISRIARKQNRSELEPLRKASAHYRSAIAAPKRRISELEARLKGASRSKLSPIANDEVSDGRQIRFSAPRLAAHRAKLGLSAKDYGALVGVSGLTIYHWESGNVRPRNIQLRAIAAVRRLGKREAQARLEAVAPTPRSRSRRQ